MYTRMHPGYTKDPICRTVGWSGVSPVLSHLSWADGEVKLRGEEEERVSDRSTFPLPPSPLTSYLPSPHPPPHHAHYNQPLTSPQTISQQLYITIKTLCQSFCKLQIVVCDGGVSL